MTESKLTYNVNGKQLTLEQLIELSKRWLTVRPLLVELSQLQGHELPYRVPPLIEQAYQLLTFKEKPNPIA